MQSQQQYEYDASDWLDNEETEQADVKESRKQSKRERQDNRRSERKLKRTWE